MDSDKVYETLTAIADNEEETVIVTSLVPEVTAEEVVIHQHHLPINQSPGPDEYSNRADEQSAIDDSQQLAVLTPVTFTNGNNVQDYVPNAHHQHYMNGQPHHVQLSPQMATHAPPSDLLYTAFQETCRSPPTETEEMTHNYAPRYDDSFYYHQQPYEHVAYRNQYEPGALQYDIRTNGSGNSRYSRSETSENEEMAGTATPFDDRCRIPLPGNLLGDMNGPESRVFVRRRNERERARVRNVNDGFERLRRHLPMMPEEDPKDRRLSKVDTLKHAIEYIHYLEDLLK